MEEGPVEPERAARGDTGSSPTESQPFHRLHSLSSRQIGLQYPKERGPLGLTTLHEPEDRAVASLIFVHGVGGGSQSTWSLDAGQHFWPRDWLSQDDLVKNARVLTFGYAWSFKQNMGLSVADIAKTLLQNMIDSPTIGRSTHGQEPTPIIFVGHSMGGIVIKKACSLAREQPEFKLVAERLFAVVFVATPHREGEMAGILAKLIGSSDGQIPHLTNLVSNFSTVQDINKGFRPISRGLKLFSFYETRPTYLASGSASLIVDKSQSSLGFHNEVCLPLDADHRSMCKFSTTRDANYLQIRNVLATLIDEARILRERVKRERLSLVDQYLGMPDTDRDTLNALNQVRVPG